MSTCGNGRAARLSGSRSASAAWCCALHARVQSLQARARCIVCLYRSGYFLSITKARNGPRRLSIVLVPMPPARGLARLVFASCYAVHESLCRHFSGRFITVHRLSIVTEIAWVIAEAPAPFDLYVAGAWLP